MEHLSKKYHVIMDGTAFSTITPDLSWRCTIQVDLKKKVTIQVELQHLSFWFWGSLTPPYHPMIFSLVKFAKDVFSHARWTGVAIATSTDSRHLEEKYPSATPGDDYSKPSTLIPFTGLIYHKYLHTYLRFTSCWCINNTYSYVYTYVYILLI